MNIFKDTPFSYYWIIKRIIGDNVETILDLGCGDGTLMESLLDGEDWEITGVELHQETYKKAKQKGIYKDVYNTDVVNLNRKIKSKKYDVVFSSQILEHLSKRNGRKALEVWERLASKKLIITTPVGFVEFDPIEKKEDNNPLQKHLSGWEPEELRQLGFKVYGQGLKLIYGKHGLARLNPPLFLLWSALGLIFSPLVYFFPRLGTYMFAAKVIN